MMDQMDQERLNRDTDKASGRDLGIVFGMIPIFCILGALLAVIAGFVAPGYSAILFGAAVLLGIGAACAYAFRVNRHTRGRA